MGHAIEGVFVDVLRLCEAAGLVSVGMIAIDGTKMAANAAMDRNRTAAWIEAEVKRIVGEAKDTDAVEDRAPILFGVDGLPAELSTPNGRVVRLGQALALIQAQDAERDRAVQERAEQARQEASEPQDAWPQTERPPGGVGESRSRRASSESQR